MELQEVKINGYTWYVDLSKRYIFEDKDCKKGTSFSFLTKDELKQLNDYINYPRNKNP